MDDLLTDFIGIAVMFGKGIAILLVVVFTFYLCRIAAVDPPRIEDRDE